MWVHSKRVIWMIMCLASLLCASCLTMTVPKTAKVEPNPSPDQVTEASLDKSLADTWELLYLVNEKGAQNSPNKRLGH